MKQAVPLLAEAVRIDVSGHDFERLILVTVGVGLATAAILALSAVAFTLEYAVSKIANFAHGEFLTIGAYVAYSTAGIFRQNAAAAALIAAAAALIAAAAGAVAGLVLNAVVVEQFRAAAPSRS